MIDAHEIVPGLWQGSLPETGDTVARAGFQTLVLCARDYQPTSAEFPEVNVIHAPFDDERKLGEPSLRTAVQAASSVARLLLQGEKILVTCFAGINRSGLVVALALHRAFGYSGRSCIELVRRRRVLAYGDTALRNLAFVDALLKLPGDELVALPGPGAIHLPPFQRSHW